MGWAEAVRLHEALLNQFIASFQSPPRRLVLDFDVPATGQARRHQIRLGDFGPADEALAPGLAESEDRVPR